MNVSILNAAPRSSHDVGEVNLTGRVRSALGTRGQRSRPTHPQPPHRIVRHQSAPFA